MRTVESQAIPNFIWRIRHTDEMRSILEVGSEQLRKFMMIDFLR